MQGKLPGTRNPEKRLNDAHSKIVSVKEKHSKIVEYCVNFNDAFSLNIFLIFTLDVCATCGYVADVMMSLENDIASLKIFYWTSIIFGMYGSVFLIPLIRVHEQVTSRFFNAVGSSKLAVNNFQGHHIMQSLYKVLHVVEHYAPEDKVYWRRLR